MQVNCRRKAGRGQFKSKRTFRRRISLLFVFLVFCTHEALLLISNVGGLCCEFRLIYIWFVYPTSLDRQPGSRILVFTISSAKSKHLENCFCFTASPINRLIRESVLLISRPTRLSLFSALSQALTVGSCQFRPNVKIKTHSGSQWVTVTHSGSDPPHWLLHLPCHVSHSGSLLQYQNNTGS